MYVIIHKLTEENLAYEMALFTEGKVPKRRHTEEWMHKAYKSEHSVIRTQLYMIYVYGAPSWVITHLVRHHIGITPFVSTQRTDRTGINRDELPQNAPVNACFLANAQAIINISRKRLCHKASKETRELWEMVKAEMECEDPILAEHMIRECEYRHECPEFKPCGYWRSNNE